MGKSTLLNSVLGVKVSITSPRPHTTRRRVLGVLDGDERQIVFVDTPGIHRPRSALGHRMNEASASAVDDADVAVAVVDARAPIGPGDRRALRRAREAAARAVVVVNKIDGVARRRVVAQLAAASALGEGGADGEGIECFPVSARTGAGVDELVRALSASLPEGPRYFPPGMVTDVPEAFHVAELVREQLLVVVADELPHAIACRVSAWEWPYIRCEILVERPSQKPIVIGRGGQVLKTVGTAVRAQLPPGAYLDLFVKVEPDWQNRPVEIERLGY